MANNELTFSIIKPDAVERSLIGKINTIFETNDLKIVGQKMIIMTKKQAEEFYGEHKERPFFQSLINSMTSGPIVVQVLSGVNAVLRNRELMGDTNPENAPEGTIRRLYATSIEANSVHGSDSLDSAKREIALFFSKDEIFE